jgi:hypothetical protein
MKATPSFHVSWYSVSPTAAKPSAKYVWGRSTFCTTRPVSTSTMRSDDWPYRPVLSYSLPSRHIRPCVNAVESCG